MSEYQSRILSIVVKPIDSNNSDLQTTISISDEGGEFISVDQGHGLVEINPDEWPSIRSAINKLIRLCK